jgi:hypothetical protein
VIAYYTLLEREERGQGRKEKDGDVGEGKVVESKVGEDSR